MPTGDPRPPTGAFDAAIHLKGRTVDEIVSSLVAAIGVTATNQQELIVAIRKRSQAGGWSATVLTDAVEEAATVAEAKAIAGLLRQLAAGSDRAGARRGPHGPEGTERATVLDAFDRGASRIDLESARVLASQRHRRLRVDLPDRRDDRVEPLPEHHATRVDDGHGSKVWLSLDRYFQRSQCDEWNVAARNVVRVRSRAWSLHEPELCRQHGADVP